jgi:SNF2 family DNA or RNA helicase
MAKLDYIDMLLDSINPDDNVAIFYEYVSHRELITALCQNKGRTLYRIDGQEKIIPPIDATNCVALVQYKAGSAAIDLSMCNKVIMFSPTYSYQDDTQALGRTYRIGQKRRVHVWRFICEGIEKEIEDCLKNKKDFSEKIYAKTL